MIKDNNFEGMTHDIILVLAFHSERILPHKMLLDLWEMRICGASFMNQTSSTEFRQHQAECIVLAFGEGVKAQLEHTISARRHG